MTKKHLRLPHTISYRLSDEVYLKLEQEIDGTGLTVHEWSRQVVLEKLDREYRLTKNQHLLFTNLVRTHYLIANAFQLLADDRLTTEEWNKLRMFAEEKIDIIAARALRDLESRMRSDAKQ
jgi:hypothetical protein